MSANAALTRDDLWGLEEYEQKRPEFRARVLAHKKARRVAIGEHATLLFESKLTIHYQVQEMLRTERLFRGAEIQDELDAYSPLIPDGGNLKATLLIEFPDAQERKRELAKLVGVEHRVWIRVIDGAPLAVHERVYAIADEDLERSTDEKTSAVHFLRFEFKPEMVQTLKAGGSLEVGIDHPNLTADTGPLHSGTCATLAQDFAK